jgi:hypothetical protein
MTVGAISLIGKQLVGVRQIARTNAVTLTQLLFLTSGHEGPDCAPLGVRWRLQHGAHISFLANQLVMPIFQSEDLARAVRFEIDRINHKGVLFGAVRSQSFN